MGPSLAIWANPVQFSLIEPNSNQPELAEIVRKCMVNTLSVSKGQFPSFVWSVMCGHRGLEVCKGAHGAQPNVCVGDRE